MVRLLRRHCWAHGRARGQGRSEPAQLSLGEGRHAWAMELLPGAWQALTSARRMARDQSALVEVRLDILKAAMDRSKRGRSSVSPRSGFGHRCQADAVSDSGYGPANKVLRRLDKALGRGTICWINRIPHSKL